MRAWLDKALDLWRCRDGVAAVEMAVVLPVLIIVFYGVTEIGRALLEANAVSRGLRAGAMYAAMSPLTPSSADVTAIENLVKTGTTDASQGFLTDGWAEPTATVTVSAPIEQTTAQGATVNVITISASVPYCPLIVRSGPGDCSGIFSGNITMSHSQVHLGNN